MQSMNARQKASKVLLVAEGRARSSEAAALPIRRFRIARVRPENRPVLAGSRAEPQRA